MKISYLPIFFIVILTIYQIPECFTIKFAKSKQDAITSLVILSKSQAESKRQSQLNVIQNKNSTEIFKNEFANLMRKTKSVNLNNLSKNLKDSSHLKSVKGNYSHKSNLEVPSNLKNSNNSYNSALKLHLNFDHKITPNETKKGKLEHREDNNIKEKSKSNNSIKLNKISTNNTLIKNGSIKQKANQSEPKLQYSMLNKKLIML